MAEKKLKITLRLACGHELNVDSRPNPRKDWPDAQVCPTCKTKKKSRVVEIHTVGVPKGYVSPQLTPMLKKKRKKRVVKKK